MIEIECWYLLTSALGDAAITRSRFFFAFYSPFPTPRSAIAVVDELLPYLSRMTYVLLLLLQLLHLLLLSTNETCALRPPVQVIRVKSTLLVCPSMNCA